MLSFKKLFSGVLVVVFSSSMYASTCNQWLPISNGDLFFIVPLKAMPHDLDCDGIVDAKDPDIDGDGVINRLDAFPRNASEFKDSDHDGVGDNADRPVAYAQNLNIEDKPYNVRLSGKDNDHSIRYIIVSQPKHGTLTGTAPNMKYVPQSGYEGTDSFSFRVNDGSLNSAVVTVILNVSLKYIVHHVHNVHEFRQALENAAANDAHDMIILAKGVYKTSKDGLGTFKFHDTDQDYILKIEAAKGLTAKDVVLDGNHENRVFEFVVTEAHVYDYRRSKSIKLVMKNLTITNGKPAEENSEGGGIYVWNSLTMKNCIVSNNEAHNKGGGIYVHTVANIQNTSIINNILKNGNNMAGAGIYIDEDSAAKGPDSILENTNIAFNKIVGESQLSISTNGGGLYTYESLEINKCTIESNDAKNGGGIYIEKGILKLANSSLNKNNARKVGGAICGFGATHYISNTVIMNNSAEYKSAIYGISVSMINTIIANNNSENDILSTTAFTGRKGQLLMVNSFIHDNHAPTLINSAKATIINSSIVGNTGNFMFYNKTLLLNSIFSSDSSLNLLRGAYNKKTEHNIYNCYIDYLKLNENGNIVVKKNNIQPSYGPLNLDNKGKPSLSSTVINKGLNFNDAVFKDLISGSGYPVIENYYFIKNTLQKDLYGHERIHNGIIDIGAVENTD